MSYSQYGYPYPHHVSQLLVSSGHGSTGTSASGGMMSIAGTGTTSSAGAPPGSGSACYGVSSATNAGSHGVCGCAQCVDYPRLATAHHTHQVPHSPATAYTSAYADQAYASQVTMHETSAFYSPLGSHYMIKDGNGDVGPWQTVGQPTGYYPYDPSLTPYGYGYDLNAAARRKNATRETTSTLKAWLNEHKKNPYPTKGEKIMLAIITKMTLTQVSTWFANARRRLKKENKMTWEQKGKEDDDDGDGDGDGDVSGGGEEDDGQEEVKPSASVAQGEDPDADDSTDKCGDSSEPSETSADATSSHVMPSDADCSQSSDWHESLGTARVTQAPTSRISVLQSDISLGISGGYSDRVSMPTVGGDPVKPKIWSLADTATCKTPPSTMPKLRSTFMPSWNAASNSSQEYRHQVSSYSSAYLSSKTLPTTSSVGASSYPVRTSTSYPMDSQVVQTDTPPQTPPNLKCPTVENFGGQRILVNSLNTRLREIHDERSLDVSVSQPVTASIFGGASRMNPSIAMFKPVYKSPYQNGHVRVV